MSTTSHRQSTGIIDQDAMSGESQWNRPHTSIHILDDDCLLHVFYLYRPFLLGEDEDDNARFWGGKQLWVDEHWWHELAHVCQRWRHVILGSASYLGVSLVCTYGTPVADMLAHSPPFPLVIDYSDDYHDFTADDEEGTILALKQRDRVRRVRFYMPAIKLQKLIAIMNEEYPILEYVVIRRQDDRDDDNSLIFPETLHAPHLRHLLLIGFALPMGSRLLTTAVGLVTLYLWMEHPSTYFHPNSLLQWLPFMLQLETFVINFDYPSHDVERQLTHTPIMTPITLPNLRYSRFQCVSAYLEAFVHQIAAPRLEKVEIIFFYQPTFSTPRLLQFMNKAENLRFDSVVFGLSARRLSVEFYPPGEVKTYALAISVDDCWHLDWQVSSAAQISTSLSQMFSPVEHLTLRHDAHSLSSEEHNVVDLTEWRRLLSSFKNVKTLWINTELVEELSRCLRFDDGELSLELLPELQELRYSGSGDTGDLFSSFINARQNADRPVTLVRRSSSPSPHPSSSASITTANEAGSGQDT